MKVSFSRGKILKGDNVKVKDSRLFLILFLSYFLFYFIFLFKKPELGSSVISQVSVIYVTVTSTLSHDI